MSYAANATVDISIQAVEISLNMSPSSADTTVYLVSETVTLPVYASDSTPITTGDISVITTLEFETENHVIQPPVDGYETITIDPLP